MQGIFYHLLSAAGRDMLMVSWTKSRGSQLSLLSYRQPLNYRSLKVEIFDGTGKSWSRSICRQQLPGNIAWRQLLCRCVADICPASVLPFLLADLHRILLCGMHFTLQFILICLLCIINRKILTSSSEQSHFVELIIFHLFTKVLGETRQFITINRLIPVLNQFNPDSTLIKCSFRFHICLRLQICPFPSGFKLQILRCVLSSSQLLC